MPRYKGLDVNVTTADGVPLSEYGYQSFPRANTISCHVEAQAGVRFCISLTPQRTFFSKLDNAGSRSSKSDTATHSLSQALADQLVLADETDVGKATRQYAASDDLGDRASREESDRCPPFDLLAWVYIDGRPKAENGTVVHLDPHHRRYRATDVIRGRWVDEGNGIFAQRAWVFADIGVDTIEHLLGELKTEEKATLAEEDVDLDSPLDRKSAPKRVGKIVVEVKRVIEKGERAGFKPRFRAGEEEAAERADSPTDVTHTTRIEDHNCEKTYNITALYVRPYDASEGVFARFEFNYISRSKLLALNMMTKEGKATTRKEWTIKTDTSIIGNKRLGNPEPDENLRSNRSLTSRDFNQQREWSL